MPDPAPTLREERMSEAFTKWHLDGLPGPAVLHRFTEPDHGDPHDHPWPFRSVVLFGGYVEERYAADGSCETVERAPGDAFTVRPPDVHRIVRLLDGECWTVICPLGPAEREPGFYRWEDGRALYRPWHRPDFQPLRTDGRPSGTP